MRDESGWRRCVSTKEMSWVEGDVSILT